MTFPVLPSNTPASGGAYNLTNSLRFRSSASAYLNRTPASTSNQKTWTWSAWVKRGAFGNYFGLSASEVDIANRIDIWFHNDDTLHIYQITGGSTTDLLLATTQVFRDPSAWYHIMFAVDTTQATSTNRVLLYVNGVQVTSFSTATYPTQNLNTYYNISTVPQYVSSAPGISAVKFDGYMAEVNFIDGQALTPTSFGAFDSVTGVWQPKKYSGSYGTNGFYLPFTNTANPTTLGYDFSGNGNNWTPNNISTTAGSTYDAMTDVPTLTSATQANYCVWNPIVTFSPDTTCIISNGNLTAAQTVTAYKSAMATMGAYSGEWYWETNITAQAQVLSMGIATASYSGGISSNSWFYHYDGGRYLNGSYSAYGASYGVGDTIGFAFDADAGSITCYKNNVSQGVLVSGLAAGTYFPAVTMYNTTTVNTTFGQQPFAYTPPTGFVALNTYNLPEPTIVNGANVMAATLYTGNGSTQTISNSANNTIGKTFYPDLTWIKDRTSAQNNVLTDSVRGATKQIQSNTTAISTTNANGLTAFSSTGFSVGNDAQYNNNTDALVAWQWNAGSGSSSTNTNGTITSTVSVNPTAGFSVVTYPGNGSAGSTYGHGLGVAPSFIITKNISVTYNWGGCYHIALGNTKNLVLDSTNAAATDNTWNNTTPSATVVTVSSNAYVNDNGENYVAYCWAAIPGYSAFGSYTGNGSATAGPFIYTGFRPRFILYKQTSASGSNWWIFDSSRNTYNTLGNALTADTNSSETSLWTMNTFSNGFQPATNFASMNGSGQTYIYAAFCENPFKYSLAR